MKKMMIIVLSAAMVLSLFMAMPFTAAAASGNWTDYASEGFAGRDGSSGSPYEIGTAVQLAHLAKSAAMGSPQSASSVSITGTAAVGQTLTGSYTYNAGGARPRGTRPSAGCGSPVRGLCWTSRICSIRPTTSASSKARPPAHPAPHNLP